MTARGLIIVLSLLAALPLGAAEDGNDKTRNALKISTYLGPVGGVDYTTVQFKDWSYVSTKTFRSTGILYSGGAQLMLFGMKYLAGDFTIRYAAGASPGIHRHLLLSVSGKVAVPLGSVAYMSVPSLGLYFETPPSSDSEYFGGAGFMGGIGFGFHITREQERENTTQGIGTILFIEGHARYGWYRRGVESSRLSFGATAGFLVKVGSL